MVQQGQGFQAFHLLRGPEREDHVLYSSHTILGVTRGFYGMDQVNDRKVEAQVLEHSDVALIVRPMLVA
jgi:hypothetical protein